MKRLFVALVLVCGLSVSAFAQWRYVCKSEEAEQFMYEYHVYKLYDNGDIEAEIPICRYDGDTNATSCNLAILPNGYYSTDKYKGAFLKLIDDIKAAWIEEKQKLIDSGECKLVEL